MNGRAITLMILKKLTFPLTDYKQSSDHKLETTGKFSQDILQYVDIKKFKSDPDNSAVPAADCLH